MPLRIPVVRFVANVFQPGVHRVIHHEAALQLLVVVLKIVGQANRDCQQAQTLGS